MTKNHFTKAHIFSPCNSFLSTSFSRKIWHIFCTIERRRRLRHFHLIFFIKKALHILSKPSFFLQIGFQNYYFTQALFHFGSYLVKKTSSSISRKKEVFKADSEQVLTWLGVLVHYWWKDLFELATTFTTWNRSTVHC